MKKISKSFIVALTVCTLIAGFSSCKKPGTPAEDAGRKIDQTVDKAGENINSAVDKMGQKIENTGKKIENAAKDSR